MEPTFVVVSALIIGLALIAVVGSKPQNHSRLEKGIAEMNRRLALVMSHLKIEDEVSGKVKELLEAKMQEAEEAVAKIDALVETRKASLKKDLQAIKDEFLGEK